MAMAVMQRLQFAEESIALVDFLIRHHTRMSLIAFRRDTEDPEIVRQLADLVGTEERLKMLCLLTLVDVEAVNPETLTPWREELLWRLYVDTYNHLTLEYADERIEHLEAGLRAVIAGRPADVTEAEITRFAEGLPRRYLQLFPHDAIYRHVRLSRDIRPDDVHANLERKASLVGADRRHAGQAVPVLEYLRRAVVVRHGHHARARDDQPERPRARRVSVHRPGALPRAQRDGARDVPRRPRQRHLRRDRRHRAAAARASRASCTAAAPASRRRRSAIHADNHSSRRYTILDIVANNALGLLHRVSRVISRHGCDVDLVLISTEGQKAIDVFHITKAGAKLTDPAIADLTADFHRMLEA